MTSEDGAARPGVTGDEPAPPLWPERPVGAGPLEPRPPRARTGGAPVAAAGTGADGAEGPVDPSTTRAGRRAASRSSRPPKQEHKRSFLRELPGIVVTALIISVLIKTFLVQAFYIPSGSMENTLQVNDRVLVNKLADKPDEIHRGDIVVFKDPGGWLTPSEQSSSSGIGGAIRKALVFVGLAPASGEEDLIKRVIGVGGDHVQGVNGHLLVNGVGLDETYLFPGDKSTESNFDVVVPKGTIWVMGDHRSVSEDSRAHMSQPGSSGFVPVSDVIGRAFVIVWPAGRAQVLHKPATFNNPQLSGSAP
ncbi:MAG: signal peptidase [Actinomycetota bacterium]|jgi:signal peptidase I|nr:signal peptidase [Actinomycetota bacterium]